jgi:hypothetical protein
MSLRRHAATAALFACLAVLHTWPVALMPGTWARTNADYSLNAWALAWVVHQAPRDPLHLFDANIFHPEPRTLAFSEHLVPQAALAAPVLWAGGSAVRAYNLVMVAGFALSGWAMAWAITRWTGHWGAGLVAGAAHAFNAHTMTRIVHVQALHVYYLPMALVALDLVFERRRWRDGVAAGAAAALQGLTSGYWLVFTITAMAAGAIARVGEWLGIAPDASSPRARRPIAILGVAGIVAALLLAPFLYPYWLAREEQGLVRPIGEVARFSATWLDYLSSTGRLHSATPLRAIYLAPPPHDVLFPGVVATLLALVAVVTGEAWRHRRARMLAAIGLAGAVLSLGPSLAPYRWLYDHLLLLQGIRAPSRFGILVLVAVAGLAGFGLAWIDGRLAAAGARRARQAVLAVVLASVTVEALRAPLDYRPYKGVSPVYDVVAQLPEPVVIAEFLMYRPDAFFRNADYMLASTVHFKRLVNGYSGFQPLSYRRMAETMQTFPDPPTTDVLRGAGVTHVIIHRDRFGADRDLLLTTMLKSGEFEPVAGDDVVRLFRLLPRGGQK